MNISDREHSLQATQLRTCVWIVMITRLKDTESSPRDTNPIARRSKRAPKLPRLPLPDHHSEGAQTLPHTRIGALKLY